MPLSVNNPIVANDIQNIKMLKRIKVWLLIGANDDKVVIKSEAVQAPQYKSVSPAVKAVAPDAKFKILTPAELGALNSFISAYEQIAEEYGRMGMAFNPDEAPAVKDLKQSMTFGAPFVKMDALQGVTDLQGALEARLQGDKTDLRAFAATLNAPGGLERLGKIIAADLFNGNSDRFWPGTPRQFRIGGMTFNLRCLQNVGNVFRVNNSGVSEVGALDFVDPNSRWKDINIPLAQAEASVGREWSGRTLAEKVKRDSFAKDVVFDLETTLSPRKSTFSLRSKLNGDAATRVANGMVQGAQLIKAKLELKYNPNRWTPGVKDRYLIVCQVL